MQTTLDQIYDLIGEAEIDKALKKLQGALSLSGSELVNDVLLLSAQYKKLQSDIRKGILDYNQENLASNRILNSLLSLVGELKETPEVFAHFSEMESEMDKAMMDKNRGVPPYAFGITNMPSELTHLALDVLERKY